MSLSLSAFASADAWIALVTLSALEIVLGIDNIVFISILTANLPEHQRPRARSLGLMLALVSRLLLLFTISWLMSLTATWFSVLGHDFSGRDLILGGGGLFLVAKATVELFQQMEPDQHAGKARKVHTMGMVLVQIALLDVVFSLDSVITAVGMARDLVVMATAVIIAIIVMLVFAGAISRFIEAHPSMKVLALSFLILVGVMLMVDAMGQHVDKGYIYFAMAFSLSVELVNMRIQARRRAKAERAASAQVTS
ncbi:MAG: TerC family protein [Polyangiales bacterium]